MTMTRFPYGFSVTVPLEFAEAVERTKSALATQGFGVLTSIDVRQTFRQKLDVDFRPYVILGACNPQFALQALHTDIDIGLLLPCNVVVYEGDAAGTSVVAVMDPIAALGLTGRDDIRPLATEVRNRLETALRSLESP
jgi:uncharacterized protein (DUF302 family)